MGLIMKDCFCLGDEFCDDCAYGVEQNLIDLEKVSPPKLKIKKK
jgi:hypothetical protein